MPIREQINAINERKSIIPHSEDGAMVAHTAKCSEVKILLSSGYGRAINTVSNYK